MKKIFCMMLIFVLVLSGCNKDSYSVYQKINKKYFHTPSYRAEGEIVYYTNKTENAYFFEAFYDGRDSHFVRYIDDGLRMYLKSDGVYIKYNQDEAVRIADTDKGYRSIFPDCFFESYYSKETSASNYKSGSVLLETEGATEEISLVKLRIDTDTLLPLTTEIYGNDEKLLCKIKYTCFDYGYKTKEELFTF